MISVSTVLPKLDPRTLLDLQNQSLLLTAQSQGTMLGELFILWSERGWSGVAIWIDVGRTHSILFTALVLRHLSHHLHSFLSTIPRYLNGTDFRLIPDGAITAAHFIKTPYYVQIHGFWDGTSMNIVRLFPIIMGPC